MKRRDWKIKKLTKNIFDNSVSTKTKKNRFFLRKLFLKKNSNLFKKNLISNFKLYKFFMLNIKKSKNNYLSKFFNKKSINGVTIYPNFFVKKQLHNEFLNYNKFLKSQNFNYIFSKKIYNLNFNFRGLNILIFSKFYCENTNELSLIINDYNKDLNNSDVIISLKSLKVLDTFDSINFNYYFNYNLNMLIELEIYKIIILCYLNKLLNN